MTDNIKRKTLAFLLLALTATVLIAVALPQLKLNPGLPLPGQEDSEELPPPNPEPAISVSVNTFFKAVLEITLILVIAYSAYQMIRKIPWKETMGPSLIIGTLTLATLGILFTLFNVQVTVDPHTPQILPPAVEGPPLEPMPPGLTWLVWIGLVVGVVLLGILLARWPTKQTQPDDLLEQEAEQALRALRIGSDLKNVIVRCYLQMSQALYHEQGIERGEAMTAREFEGLLEARGIPHTPVHQLTQLFEVARYGYRQPGPSDEQQAFECLSAIVQYSREREQLD